MCIVCKIHILSWDCKVLYGHYRLCTLLCIFVDWRQDTADIRPFNLQPYSLQTAVFTVFVNYAEFTADCRMYTLDGKVYWIVYTVNCIQYPDTLCALSAVTVSPASQNILETLAEDSKPFKRQWITMDLWTGNINILQTASWWSDWVSKWPFVLNSFMALPSPTVSNSASNRKIDYTTMVAQLWKHWQYVSSHIWILAQPAKCQLAGWAGGPARQLDLFRLDAS